MNKILTIAALALVLSACSNEDNDIQTPVEQPAKSEGIPFTATISIGENAMTRALTEDATNNQIVPTWAAGENVALIHNGVNDEMSVASVSGGVATITGTITGTPTTGDPVTVIYPATAADGTTGNVKANLLAAQDGTLATIATNYDVRKGTGTLKVSGTASLNGNVSLTNQNAIFKFTLQDLSAGAKSATEFKVSDNSGNVMTTVTPGSASGELYVALPVMAAGTYWFNATIDSKPYIAKATTAAATVAGKYYQTTVKMATVGNIIGADGKFYANKTAVDAAATTGAAMIVYLGSDGETNATYNHGLAIALTDASTDAKWGTYNADAGLTKYTHWCQGDDDASTDMTGIANTAALKTLYNGNTDYEAANAVSGYSVAGFTPGDHGFSGWFLPSAGQWYKFLNGMCGLAWTGGWDWATGTGSDNFNTVNAKFTAAGYDTDDAKFEDGDWYWSSSEYSLRNAVNVNFDSDSGVLVGHNGKVGYDDRVRCFLAF